MSEIWCWFEWNPILDKRPKFCGYAVASIVRIVRESASREVVEYYLEGSSPLTSLLEKVGTAAELSEGL